MNAFSKYLSKHTQKSQSYFSQFSRLAFDKSTNDFREGECDIAVVIPALAEREYIQKTIESLFASYTCMKNNTTYTIRVGIIVVVNNKKSHTNEIKQNNADTIALLNDLAKQFFDEDFLLYVGDCTAGDFCIPEREGVGLVRKIGMDFALTLNAKMLCCFDADTLCDTQYFTEIAKHLELTVDGEVSETQKFFAAVADFTHQKAESESLQIAIDMYENYLKTHSKKLQECGTPFYPVALGPTLVCNATAYTAIGGMNCRVAGEDFYFLQKLIKTSPNMKIPTLKTVVYPNSRVSDRTLFGTGQTLNDFQINNKKLNKYTFSGDSYKVLKAFIDLIETVYLCTNNSSSSEICIQNNTLLEKLKAIDGKLCDFLYNEDFFEIWNTLCIQNRNENSRRKAFYTWFDGLKVIRLFHSLQ